MYKNPFEKGRLIIQFNVKFPENGQIDVKKLPELERILPARARVEIPVDSEEHNLVDLDPATERNRRHQDVDMDDDQHMHGGKRVQCANQWNLGTRYTFRRMCLLGFFLFLVFIPLELFFLFFNFIFIYLIYKFIIWIFNKINKCVKIYYIFIFLFYKNLAIFKS